MRGQKKGDGGVAMAPHPRYQRSLEELFLHTYVYIDDWLESHQGQLPKHPGQKASISELLTIAVVGELLAQRDCKDVLG